MTTLIKLHLLRARDRMKHQADKNRSERVLAVGDKVFIKLQPYVQSSVARRACHKGSFKYFCPFTITARIGQVAYRVALPETSSVHPVFHVSLLRKALKAQRPTDSLIKYWFVGRVARYRTPGKASMSYMIVSQVQQLGVKLHVKGRGVLAPSLLTGADPERILRWGT